MPRFRMSKSPGQASYDVGTDMLPESGMGDVTTGDATYRVMMMDGGLTGMRLDPVAIDGNTDFWTIGLSTTATIPGDGDDTEDVDEATTVLRVAGEGWTFVKLLADGSSPTESDNFVATAGDELGEIQAKIVASLDVFDSQTELDLQRHALWGTAAAGATVGNRDVNVKVELAQVFGRADFIGRAPNDDDTLDVLDEMIAALSSADWRAGAFKKDRLLGGAPANDMTAEETFGRRESANDGLLPLD